MEYMATIHHNMSLYDHAIIWPSQANDNQIFDTDIKTVL